MNQLIMTLKESVLSGRMINQKKILMPGKINQLQVAVIPEHHAKGDVMGYLIDAMKL